MRRLNDLTRTAGLKNLLNKDAHIFMNRKILAVLSCILVLASVYAESGRTDPSEARSRLIAEAKKYLNVPYVYGGIDYNGMDCSGLIFVAARDGVGLDLPRTAGGMYNDARIVDLSQLEPGDLLFFKTTGNNKVSHVGLFIGNSQFIHSASDGPVTGVIISSMGDSYWSKTFCGIGQILPPAKAKETAAAAPVAVPGTAEKPAETSVPAATKPSEEKPAVSSATEADEKTEIIRNVTEYSPDYDFNQFRDDFGLDVSLAMDWNFFTANDLSFNLRGASLQANLQYKRYSLRPGVGFGFKWIASMNALQIPLIFSLNVNDYCRFYMGPVLTLGKPVLKSINEPVNASIFPGILGFSWQTPRLLGTNPGISIMQDISYTVFNNTQDGALPPMRAFAAGLAFTTGIRVTFDQLRFF